MVKAIHRGQAKQDDPIYNRGYTIAVQPLKQKPEAKAAPKKRAGKPKKQEEASAADLLTPSGPHVHQ